MVVPGGTDGVLLGPGVDVGGHDERLLVQDVLERLQPLRVVAVRLALGRVGLPGGDTGDQVVAEGVVGQDAALGEGHHQAEGTSLPGLLEDELAVGAGRGGWALEVELVDDRRHGAVTFVTPTIASRETRAASSVSDSDSVPAGRSGRMK